MYSIFKVFYQEMLLKVYFNNGPNNIISHSSLCINIM